MNILTNHPGQIQSRTWEKSSTYIPVDTNVKLSLIISVIKMHLIKKTHYGIVLGAGRSDLLFLLINTILFMGRRKCIVIDCLWYEKRNPFSRYIKKLIFKVADFSVSKYVVWASREIEAYSRAFSLPRDKFVFIPYHHTVNDFGARSSKGDYLFSGGNFGRDYNTLIEAVRGLPIKLLIASNRPEIFKEIDVPDNVTIKGFSHREYLEKMAGCFINIVALAPNLLHSGGQQTFLNSMYFGKPTIVLDPEGASDYITDGVDGVLVEPGKPLKLKTAIMDLVNNPAKAMLIGAEGKKKALKYSTESHFKKIVELVNDVANVDSTISGIGTT